MFTRITLCLVFLVGALAGDMTISTPAALIQCQPVQLKWDGGQAPYFLAAIPGGQPSAPALKDFGQQDGTSLVWTVDLPSGTSVTLRLTDSAGTINYAQAVTIQPGSSTSCEGGAVAAAAVSSADDNSIMSAMPSSMSSSMSHMSASAMSISASANMSSTAMSGSVASKPSETASSMSRSSMSRSAISSAPASSSSVSTDDRSDSVGGDSDASNDATAVLTTAKGGTIAFLVGAFAIAWI